MPGRGGARPGAGRKKGGHNRLTEQAAKMARETGATPLEYLLEVMRDIQAPRAERLDAAKAAAPYVHPKLAAVDMTVDGTISVSHEKALEQLA